MQSLRAVRSLRVVYSAGPYAPIRMLNTSTNISGGSMGKAWADKEHAAENQYFNKKDAEVLAKLADKLKNHTAPTAESMAVDKETLMTIFAKHEVNPSDALVDDIMKFKYNDH